CRAYCPLMPPRMLVKWHPHKTLWRRRVEVESTIRPAKGRIAGFEGREGHRTPFAPVAARSSDYRLYSTYSTCASSATGCVGRERFPAARLTALQHPPPANIRLSGLFWSGLRVCSAFCDEPHIPLMRGSLYNVIG